MARRAPFSVPDHATAPACGPHELVRDPEQLLSYIRGCAPEPPVSTTARLAARRASAAAPDGVDRISGLSDALLRDIVSRLPCKDAARTAVLAARWRGVWLAAPLAVVDAHLLGRRSPRTRGPSAAPTSCPASWTRASPTSSAGSASSPPRASRSSSSSTDPARGSLQGASFPNLRELGVCSVIVEDGDIDSLVARSPVLEILNLQGSMKGLRLVSRSLRCVQICTSVVESIAVVNTPCFDRLILWEVRGSLNPASGLRTRIKIGIAPKLRILGYLDPSQHLLQIGGTVIMAGIKPSSSTILTSVKTLSLTVCFGANGAMMVPAILKCFPNVEALHIMSTKCDEPANKLNIKLWQEADAIVSVLFRIKVMTIHEFRGEQHELAFLQFFYQNARNMDDSRWANEFGLAILGSTGPEGDREIPAQQWRPVSRGRRRGQRRDAPCGRRGARTRSRSPATASTAASFDVGGYSWCIRFYPDGYADGEQDSRDDGDDDNVAAFLELLTEDAEVRAHYDFRLLDRSTGTSSSVFSTAAPQVFDTLDVKEDNYFAWGTDELMERSELEEASAYLVDDSLVIECDVTVIMEPQVEENTSMAASDVEVPPSSDLSSSFGKLLEMEERADVIFKVEDEVFHAHKVVLAVRSPIFVAEPDEGLMLDKGKECIVIEDMQPAVFKALLHFIYTDTLPAMEGLDGDGKKEIVKQLLVAADSCRAPLQQPQRCLCQSSRQLFR
ncbi:hypothetical protein C2845_PM13G06890 [Panicum miliaceum]|uniref:BTB domain-containing protein n=1 Tax=Panicum miliaceum TaxID=4540 RepID=A0A3L6RJ38_PANMI|nr:hypothetical protein C2845_PM13G06890 [Panicum miliaceum]